MPLNKMIKKAGFTLIELLLSIATITVIAGISVPLYLRSQTKNDLDVAAQSYAYALRRAQVLSMADQDDSVWGANIVTGQIVVYKGSSYAGRDITFDEITKIPTNILISGSQEVYFTKVFGIPSATSTTTLTSVNNDSRTISINSKGLVSF